jgi:hypothetical protein
MLCKPCAIVSYMGSAAQGEDDMEDYLGADNYAGESDDEGSSQSDEASSSGDEGHGQADGKPAAQHKRTAPAARGGRDVSKRRRKGPLNIEYEMEHEVEPLRHGAQTRQAQW